MITRKRIIGAVVLNFVSYWIIAVLIGGDAVNGYAENGHYVLMNHGYETKVSRWLFVYSMWHSVVTILSPLALLSIRVFRIE